MNTAVIFGGTGFIGVHFAKYLLDNNYVDKVYLLDIDPIEAKTSEYRKKLIRQDLRLIFVKADVRESLDWFTPNDQVVITANFAAIHREPGHEDWEYYKTNLLGAENVCTWAEGVGCDLIVFISSISPYGASEDLKDERSLPMPITPYGVSKLVAERIHQIWQARDDSKRRLIIVRPGVVFGPGECGNVTRLIKAVVNRYFFYMGNKSTRKSGVYVKELCCATLWVLQRLENSGEHVILFNMSMNPAPSIQDYVNSVCKVVGVKRLILSVPYPLLLTIAYLIELFARPLGLKHPFSPVRVRKLVRSNNILPHYLIQNGYKYCFSLEAALTDWYLNCPEEWIKHPPHTAN